MICRTPFADGRFAGPRSIPSEPIRLVRCARRHIESFVDIEAGRLHVKSEHSTAAPLQLPKWLAGAAQINHVETDATGWSQMSGLSVDAVG